mmetsp:Transcript_9784/g.35573  ORF Transcript_9784/g.35573 Transcript_9784/m.35573 type:complete len:240 (-) Transcript_9784:284-1003(-)
MQRLAGHVAVHHSLVAVERQEQRDVRGRVAARRRRRAPPGGVHERVADGVLRARRRQPRRRHVGAAPHAALDAEREGVARADAARDDVFPRRGALHEVVHRGAAGRGGVEPPSSHLNQHANRASQPHVREVADARVARERHAARAGRDVDRADERRGELRGDHLLEAGMAGGVKPRERIQRAAVERRGRIERRRAAAAGRSAGARRGTRGSSPVVVARDAARSSLLSSVSRRRGRGVVS